MCLFWCQLHTCWYCGAQVHKRALVREDSVVALLGLWVRSEVQRSIEWREEQRVNTCCFAFEEEARQNYAEVQQSFLIRKVVISLHHARTVHIVLYRNNKSCTLWEPSFLHWPNPQGKRSSDTSLNSCDFSTICVSDQWNHSIYWGILLQWF